MIYQGISENGHSKELVDGLNAIGKRYIYIYIYKLVSNVQLPGSKRFDSQIQMHTITQNNYVSLTKKFQQH